MLFRKPKYVCKAAEYSLLFQPSGEVLACHYNRGYILGLYPNDSINDIWFGKKRSNLVKSIRSGKFETSCHFCKLAIEQNLIHKAGINKYEYIVPDKHKMPVSMEFQLDNICNLECIMCSGEYSSQIRKNREKGEPYISPYDNAFVEQIEEFLPYLRQASFTGGEPFLFDIYYKMWDRIKILNPDLPIYISTNGTVLNDKVKEYMQNLNFNFAISIDSLNKDSYERIRKNAKLADTLKNIDYFINYCKSKNRTINIKCLVTPLNYQDIPSLIDYFNNREINVIPKTVILPGFAAMENILESELEKIINFFDNINLKTESLTQRKNLERFEEIKRQIIFTLEKKKSKNEGDFTILDIGKIKEALFNHIFAPAKSNKHVSETEKANFESLFETNLSEIELHKAVTHFLNTPSEAIRSEFFRKDFEKLKARFIQSAK